MPRQTVRVAVRYCGSPAMKYRPRPDAHRNSVMGRRAPLSASRRPRGPAGNLCVVSASVQSSRRSAHVFGDFMKRLIIAACTAVSLLALATSAQRSEEHTSELQSLMRISYAVFCLKKKNIINNKINHDNIQHQYVT